LSIILCGTVENMSTFIETNLPYLTEISLNIDQDNFVPVHLVKCFEKLVANRHVLALNILVCPDLDDKSVEELCEKIGQIRKTCKISPFSNSEKLVHFLVTRHVGKECKIGLHVKYILNNVEQKGKITWVSKKGDMFKLLLSTGTITKEIGWEQIILDESGFSTPDKTEEKKENNSEVPIKKRKQNEYSQDEPSPKRVKSSITESSDILYPNTVIELINSDMMKQVSEESVEESLDFNTVDDNTEKENKKRQRKEKRTRK